MFFGLALFLLQHISYAQSALVVRQRNKTKSNTYLIGQDIKFKTKEGKKVNGQLERLFYDSIQVNNGFYKLSEIKTFYIQRKNFNFLENGIKFIIAGGLYSGIVMLNSAINDDTELLPQRIQVASGAISGTGVILCLLAVKRVHIRGLNKVYVL